MITRVTKIQLLIFAIITLLGTTYVGAKYAELDRVFIERSYPVTAKFKDSGGIFAGAQVTYRGIEVGKVKELSFTDAGVDVILEIEKDAPPIAADAIAVVANKSAIGEQFVDLQPQSDRKPYLAKDSVIKQRNTRIPIDATELLVNVDDLVSSVDAENMRTVVSELGAAFQGAGPDLERIVRTSTAFIQEADANIGVTRQLIYDSSGVLQTQIDKKGQLATFSDNLALVSKTLVESDDDIRYLVDEGAPAARDTRRVVDQNADDIGAILRNLRVANRPLVKNIDALRIIAVLYPYALEGSFSVVAPSQDKTREGEYDATFGLVIPKPGTVDACRADESGGNGYRARRPAADLSDIEFNLKSDCTDESRMPARTPKRARIDRDRTPVASLQGKDALSWLLLETAKK